MISPEPMTATQPMTSVQSNPLVLVDAHVHLHPCFQVDQVLSNALDNFSQTAADLGSADNFVPCMLLTEMRNEDWFTRHYALVHHRAGDTSVGGGWRLLPTDETCSLLAVHESGETIVLVAGRQVVTRERLEVLALLTAKTFADGQSLTDTVNAIAEAGGIPVLPWGVGKWLGHRGQLVAQLLQGQTDATVYLGDNSGRPLGWPRPKNFALADQQRLPILPGTDPLPMASEASRIGRFGFALYGALDPQRPGRFIAEQLGASSPVLKAYGSLEAPLRFVKNQLALRLQKSA